MEEISNKRAVEVNIHSEFRSKEDTMPMDVYTTGSLYQKNNNLYLVYDDVEEDETTSRTILKVESGKRVTMTKKGWSEMHFVLEKGTHSVGYYVVPEGTITMGVTTTRFEDHLTPEGGTLQFTYNTDSGGFEMFENNMTIRINLAGEE